MTFQGLDLSSTSSDVDTGPLSREDRIETIANVELKKLLSQGWRRCKIAPKFVDPKLQFWHQCLTEEGFGSLVE
jgi:hypothetical protein